MNKKPGRRCTECNKPLTGRADQKFCDAGCRSAWHYRQQQQDRQQDMYRQINKQLKTNRRLLKRYNRAGKATVHKEKLLAEGFEPRYITHYWKAANGNTYLFCYEYGFRQVIQNGKAKYVLVTWQPYMQ